MTRVIITTVSFVIAAFILAACSSNSIPETNPEPAYSAAASEMYLGASLAPYASPNEPVWSPGKAAPNSVPTPPGIAEEVEEDEEEGEEEDPNQTVRQALVVIKKSIATQIREDTNKRVAAITIAQMANEDKLEREIAKQYAEAKAAEEALVSSQLAGGAHHFGY